MEKPKYWFLEEDFIGPGLVVPIEQGGDEDCCVAVVQSILIANQIKAEYHHIYKSLGTTKDGTEDVELIKKTLKTFGVHFEEQPKANLDALGAALLAKYYCLIEYQAPDSDYRPRVIKTGIRKRIGKSLNHGHYSLVFAQTQDCLQRKIYWLMDPLVKVGETPYGEGIRTMSESLLRKRWKDCDTKGEWMLTIPTLRR